MKRKNGLKYLGFMGFFGFFGFDYFLTKNVGVLFMFSFFSYFSYFVLDKLLAEKPDERFAENSAKALSRVFFIPMCTIFILGFGAQFSFFTKELVVIVSSLGWVATILSYIASLYHFEKY